MRAGTRARLRLAGRLLLALQLAREVGKPQGLLVTPGLGVRLDYGHTAVAPLTPRLGVLELPEGLIAVSCPHDLHRWRLEVKSPVDVAAHLDPTALRRAARWGLWLNTHLTHVPQGLLAAGCLGALAQALLLPRPGPGALAGDAGLLLFALTFAAMFGAFLAWPLMLLHTWLPRLLLAHALRRLPEWETLSRLITAAPDAPDSDDALFEKLSAAGP